MQNMNIGNIHHKFMNLAIEEAKKGKKEDGIPIGAVLVKNGQVIARGHNRRVQRSSVILHAEMDCLENAGRLREKDYRQCVLYSTLSPCDMCSGAILLYGIPTLVIGENDTYKGPEEYCKKRGVEITNLNSGECKQLMKEFINKQPKLWYEDSGGG